MAHSFNRVGNAPRFVFQISNTKFQIEQSRPAGHAGSPSKFFDLRHRLTNLLSTVAVTMSESKSLIRQWRLLRQLADARVGYTVKELLADMSVSIETIRRDLIAWSSRRGEIRTYKMDRIEDMHSTKLPAAVPQNFDLAEWLEHSFGVFRIGSTELQTIRIHFARDVAQYVQESRWHGSQQLTPQPDGSLIAEFSLPDTQEIKRWIMSFGVNATVLDPHELVEEIQNDLRQMLRLYAPEREVS